MEKSKATPMQYGKLQQHLGFLQHFLVQMEVDDN
jgi:hypothetical protein